MDMTMCVPLIRRRRQSDMSMVATAHWPVPACENMLT